MGKPPDDPAVSKRLSASGPVDLEESLAAYGTVVSRFGFEPIIRPGRINILGWDLEYVCGPALANFIDQILVRRLNDFVPDREDPVILDCGANIGFTALNYKRQLPLARIVAFEPDPRFLPVLRGNLVRNGAADVEVIEAAAWIRDGEARWFCEGIDGSKIVEGGPEPPDTITVRTVDLAAYLDVPVDLLKLDIEGAEYAVISHLGPRLDRVRNILIECHLDQSNVVGFGRMLGVLVSAGFKVCANSFGQWRDLVRQPPVAPHHWEQYLVVAGWRGALSASHAEEAVLPYLGAQHALELRGLRAEAENLREALSTATFRLQSLAAGGDHVLREPLQKPFANDGGFCWIARIPGFEHAADNEERPTHSRLLLLEGDRLLGPAHALHADIRKSGGGCYSHWKSNLYFSTPDNSDPNQTGEEYWAVIP